MKVGEEDGVEGEIMGMENAEDDHINRLPDDVLITIFNKVLEAKYLFSCSLVSKRFASLVPFVHTLTILVPFPWFDPKPSVQQIEKISGLLTPLKFLDHLFLSRTNPICSDQKHLTSFVHFLKQFHCIQTLHLNHLLFNDYHPNFCHHFVKWRMELKSQKSIVFLILLGRRFTANDDVKLLKKELDTTERRCLQVSLEYCVLDAYARCLALSSIFEDRDVRVQQVVIRNENADNRKIVVSEEELVHLKDHFVWFDEKFEYRMKWSYWYVPWLRLSSSDGVMKEVKLALMYMGYGDRDGELDCASNGGDGAKDTSFNEAVTEIMKTKPFHTSLVKRKGQTFS